MDVEQLFISNLPLIERVVASIARRYRLATGELDDFASIVNLKLIENDYAVLRQHEGRSALSTYLFVVVQRCYFAYRDQQSGRWRPSAEASRLGETAIALEQLMHRDQWTFSEAAERLLGRDQQLTRTEIERIYSRLPDRPPRYRTDGETALNFIASNDAADERLVDRELMATAARIRSALAEVLEDTGTDERTILRLRFVEGVRPAEIARMLNTDVARVYKRLELLLRRLRRAFQAAGIDGAAASELIERRSVPLDLALADGGIVSTTPSQKAWSEERARSGSGK